MKLTRLQSAFTLIETLVAVAILMVAIAGPLDIANKGLVAAVTSRDQTVASYLAEDLLESVKNVRDYNISSNPTTPTAWLNGFTSCLSSTSPCIMETSNFDPTNPTITPDNDCTFIPNPVGAPVTLYSSCELYTDPNTGYYTYNSSGNTATPFYRSFYITPNATPGSALVTVSVYWVSGTLLNDVVLQNEIFDTAR